jgi:tRNA threonylcarbamoyladenosine modification (KEOPS) complex  Pcc1 subunit
MRRQVGFALELERKGILAQVMTGSSEEQFRADINTWFRRVHTMERILQITKRYRDD